MIILHRYLYDKSMDEVKPIAINVTIADFNVCLRNSQPVGGELDFLKYNNYMNH